MTRAISSYPVNQQQSVISRRLHNQTHGAGYWAAIDATKHVDLNTIPLDKKPSKQQVKETSLHEMLDMEESNATE